RGDDVYGDDALQGRAPAPRALRVAAGTLRRRRRLPALATVRPHGGRLRPVRRGASDLTAYCATRSLTQLTSAGGGVAMTCCDQSMSVRRWRLAVVCSK